MLINKSSIIKAGDVAGFRLVSGEEMLARVAEVTATHLTVSKPVVVQMAPTGNGGVGLAFAPFMVTVPEDSRYVFSMDKLISPPLPARKELADKYTEMTSSIVPASAGSLIGLNR